MNEWRDVPGYEGKYQVSIDTPQGRCRRFYKNGNVRKLSNKPRKDVRLIWGLCKNGIQTKQQAAVWIALTYPELVQNEWFPGAEIDHIDTDRMNNHPSNLRWVDRVGQMNNPLTRVHNSEAQKGIHINNLATSKGVIQFSLDNEVLHFYPSTKQAQRETGIDYRSISRCSRGKSKSAGGYKWRYVNNFPPLVLRLLRDTYLVGNLLSRNAC